MESGYKCAPVTSSLSQPTSYTKDICTKISCSVTGYAGSDGACTCAAGYYGTVTYIDNVLGGCTACPAGSYKTTASNGGVCTNVASCTTTTGFDGSPGACACASGYSGSVAVGATSATLSGCYIIGSAACVGTGYTYQSSACVCAAGYYGSPTYVSSVLAGCSSCPGGSYKSFTGNAGSCTSVTSCTATSGYAGSPGACTCAAGYSGIVGLGATTSILTGCTACAGGSYNTAAGNGVTCTNVASCTTSTGYAGSVGACTCAAGYSGTVASGATTSTLTGCTG